MIRICTQKNHFYRSVFFFVYSKSYRLRQTHRGYRLSKYYTKWVWSCFWVYLSILSLYLSPPPSICPLVLACGCWYENDHSWGKSSCLSTRCSRLIPKPFAYSKRRARTSGEIAVVFEKKALLPATLLPSSVRGEGGGFFFGIFFAMRGFIRAWEFLQWLKTKSATRLMFQKQYMLVCRACTKGEREKWIGDVLMCPRRCSIRCYLRSGKGSFIHLFPDIFCSYSLSLWFKTKTKTKSVGNINFMRIKRGDTVRLRFPLKSNYNRLYFECYRMFHDIKYKKPVLRKCPCVFIGLPYVCASSKDASNIIFNSPPEHIDDPHVVPPFDTLLPLLFKEAFFLVSPLPLLSKEAFFLISPLPLYSKRGGFSNLLPPLVPHKAILPITTPILMLPTG